MKASKFSERQIMAILKSQTADKTAEQICHEHGIAPAAFSILGKRSMQAGSTAQ